MPARFEKMGIQFQYPENWTLDEQDALEEQPSVSVYAPSGTAFWSITKHSDRDKPADLTEAALTAMRQIYDELDAEEVEESLAGKDLQGYDMNFYCLDLTNTAKVRSFRDEAATYVVLCQAEDREFDQIGPVFQAMTASLKTRG